METRRELINGLLAICQITQAGFDQVSAGKFVHLHTHMVIE